MSASMLTCVCLSCAPPSFLFPPPQSKLQQLEEALLAESVGGLAADGDSSDGEGSEDGVAEEQGSEEGSPAPGGGLSRSQASHLPFVAAHSAPLLPVLPCATVLLLLHAWFVPWFEPSPCSHIPPRHLTACLSACLPAERPGAGRG
jgi:hypothetical protein